MKFKATPRLQMVTLRWAGYWAWGAIFGLVAILDAVG